AVLWLAAAGLLLAVLASCAPMPRLVPDLALKPEQPIQIGGVRGQASPARSKAMLDALKTAPGEQGILDRHLAVEESLNDSPLVADNQVTLLQDGNATYDAMLAAIGAARHHINMETYILQDDEAGRRFAAALIAKRRQGVRVNLLYDSVGTLSTPPAFFQRLRDEGITLVEYNPINPLQAKAGWDVNERDHRKLLVIDGEMAFLGGINISGVYSGASFKKRAKSPPAAKPARPWRDTDLRIEGPVVAEFQKLFLETWAQQYGPPLAAADYAARKLQARGRQIVRAIGSSPREARSAIYSTLMSSIEHAEKEILITTAYFVPDPRLLDALCDAARRKVDVKLILPLHSDVPLVLSAGRSHYGTLLRAGVKLFERRTVLLHSKTAVIDGVWSTVGSTNLDWRSFVHNLELNAVVLGGDFGSQMQAAFARDLAESDPITLEAWERRSLGDRLSELAGRLLEYWL
ncbi:MAG TPA: cardiolipin synthase, partial [Ideonella sp.]|nr:cardiolipin synthase [Ideonella sp.]